MNILVCSIALILISGYILVLSERNYMLVKALYAWEKSKKNTYLLEGLLVYGIALLKEKNVVPLMPYEISLSYATHQAKLFYTLKGEGIITIQGMLVLDTGIYKGSCTISQRNGIKEIISWLEV